MARESTGKLKTLVPSMPQPEGKPARNHPAILGGPSSDPFASVVCWAPLGLFRARRNGTFIAVNEYMAEMLGYSSKGELLGRNLEQDVYFDPSQRRVNLMLVESRGTALKLETRWRMKDGTPIWVELTGHVVDQPGEEEKCFEGLAIEITERKAAEDAIREGERKMSTLLGNLPGIAYRARDDGRCTMEFDKRGMPGIDGVQPARPDRERHDQVSGSDSFRRW